MMARNFSNVLILSGILLLISCGTPLENYQPKNDTEKDLKETILRHANARMQGDVNQILSGLSENCQIELYPGAKLSKNQLKSVNVDDWNYDGDVHFSDPEFTIAGDKASVSLKLNLGIAGKRLTTIELIRENNTWLISQITFRIK